MDPNQILIKWINYHLGRADVELSIKNLGTDLEDSEALLLLLNCLNRKNCPLDAVNREDKVDRATAMVDNAQSIGVPNFITAHDILASNANINTIFCSFIFNTNHGIKPVR